MEAAEAAKTDLLEMDLLEMDLGAVAELEDLLEVEEAPELTEIMEALILAVLPMQLEAAAELEEPEVDLLEELDLTQELFQVMALVVILLAAAVEALTNTVDLVLEDPVAAVPAAEAETKGTKVQMELAVVEEVLLQKVLTNTQAEMAEMELCL